MAARGAKVHILCRNKAKGEAAIQEIKNATGQLILHEVDISRPAQVKAFVSDFVRGTCILCAHVKETDSWTHWSTTQES